MYGNIQVLKAQLGGANSELKECEIEFINFNEYKELKQLNTCTKEYYRDEYKNGRRFGMFHLIPHVLVKGKVEVKNIEIINWSIAPVNG